MRWWRRLAFGAANIPFALAAWAVARNSFLGHQLLSDPAIVPFGLMALVAFWLLVGMALYSWIVG